MKNLFLLSLIVFSMVLVKPAVGQVNVNINIGSQPLWGPVGYDYARFYYMPEIDVYYNVASRNYTYYQGNRWVTRSKLPGKYKKFNTFRTYKVVLNSSAPWQHHTTHRNTYRRYANNYNQVTIRDGRKSSFHSPRHDKHDHKKSHKSHRKGNKRR